MDHTSPFLPEQQKWNEFVSKYGQALDDWRQNNNGKIPTDMQKREIAQGILFPNGISGLIFCRFYCRFWLPFCTAES